MSGTIDMSSLSPSYKDYLETFLLHHRRRRNQRIEDIEEHFEDALRNRVKDCGPFGEDDVMKIISDVKGIVSSSIMEELGSQVHEMSASLLKVFQEADACSLAFPLSSPAILPSELVADIVKLESRRLPQQKAASAAPITTRSKLPSLMSDSLSQAKSGVEMGEENTRLREKLAKMQENYTQILKSKHDMEEAIEKERMEKDKIIKEQAKKIAELEPQLENLTKEVEDLKSSLSALGRDHSESSTLSREYATKISHLQEKCSDLEKQMTQRVSESSQFKSLRKIVASKNDEIKALRKQLESSGKSASVAEEEEVLSSDSDVE
eukprot:TRINITY_DN31185_c0_g1_i1.p1 TRINITY_DN31185_c0_g1~~TRINITY_DN31185_c0_g1_i1.p1  ORF type:complete len:322 (-),score=122.19 TRINITY_DN31185_c0_g1_i1:124-1089(-)